MDFNFKKIGTVNVSNIKNFLSKIDENIWVEYVDRQSYAPNPLMKETETIPIIFDIESITDNNNATISKYYSEFNIGDFIKSIKPLYENEFGIGDFKRILLVRLKKGCKIKAHVDDGYSLILCNRTHIPIVTNENVLFNVDGETKNLREGEIWEIANQKIHSVNNNSDIDRIHMVIDYLPKSKLINKNLI